MILGSGHLDKEDTVFSRENLSLKISDLETKEILYLRKNVIKAMWRLTLRRRLTQSLELKFSCENVAFFLDIKYINHISAQLLIGNN